MESSISLTNANKNCLRFVQVIDWWVLFIHNPSLSPSSLTLHSVGGSPLCLICFPSSIWSQSHNNQILRKVFPPLFIISDLFLHSSDEITDSVLSSLTEYNKNLRCISLVDCPQITDLVSCSFELFPLSSLRAKVNEKQRKNGIIQGIQSLTADQIQLETLELRAMNSLTEDAFHAVRADYLKTVDLSGCIKVRKHCTYFALWIRSPSQPAVDTFPLSLSLLQIKSLRHLLGWNRLVSRLSINSCTGLDDQAFYDIAYFLGEHLVVCQNRLSNRT